MCCINLADHCITLHSICEKILLYKRKTSILTKIKQPHIAFFSSQFFFHILTWFIDSGFECKAELLKKKNKPWYHEQVHVCISETEKWHLQILHSLDAVQKPPWAQQTTCNITKIASRSVKAEKVSHGIEEKTSWFFFWDWLSSLILWF